MKLQRCKIADSRLGAHGLPVVLATFACLELCADMQLPAPAAGCHLLYLSHVMPSWTAAVGSNVRPHSRHVCNLSQVGTSPADGGLPPSFEGGEQRCFRRMFVCSEDLSQVGAEGRLVMAKQHEWRLHYCCRGH